MNSLALAAIALALLGCSETKTKTASKEKLALSPPSSTISLSQNSPAPKDASPPLQGEGKQLLANPEAKDAGQAMVEAPIEEPPAKRRLEPMSGWNPTHATVRMLRKLGTKSWSLEPFIDKERGLFLLRDDPGNQISSKRVSKLYCGAELVEGKTAALKILKDAARRTEDGEGSCSNKPSPPRCVSHMTSEYEPDLVFHFAQGPRGIVLDAIYEVMGNYEGPIRLQKKILARANRERLALGDVRCPVP